MLPGDTPLTCSSRCELIAEYGHGWTRVKDILDATEHLAEQTARLMPPITVDDVHNKLVNIVARHGSRFENLRLRGAVSVLRKSAHRFAREQREQE